VPGEVLADNGGVEDVDSHGKTFRWKLEVSSSSQWMEWWCGIAGASDGVTAWCVGGLVLSCSSWGEGGREGRSALGGGGGGRRRGRGDEWG